MKVRRVVFPGDLADWTRIAHLLTELRTLCSSAQCDLKEIVWLHQEIYDLAASNPVQGVTPKPLSKCIIYGLYRYFEEVADETDRRMFIRHSLPTILHYSLQIASNAPKEGLCIAEQQTVRCVELSRHAVASIVSCAFLCLFPERNPDSSNLNAINFTHFFQSLTSTTQYTKLRCILHYFYRLSQADFTPTGAVIFTRQKMSREALPNLDTWLACDNELCPLIINQHGHRNEAAAILDQEPLEVHCQSGFSGCGILLRDDDQDESRLCVSPELLASLLFMEKLEDNESILIRGTEQFSRVMSDGARDFKDQTKRDICGNLESAVCMIGDEVDVRPLTPEQLVLSTLNHLIIGFRFCEESRVHGRSSTVMKPDFSLDDDEFFSATESPDRSECESPVLGYSSMLSSVIVSEAMNDAILSIRAARNPVVHKRVPASHIRSCTDDSGDNSLSFDNNLTEDGALRLMPDTTGIPVSLINDLVEYTDGNVNDHLYTAVLNKPPTDVFPEDETSYLLNGFATNLADNVIDQVVSVVIKKESDVTNMAFSDTTCANSTVCAKCRLKRPRSTYSESDGSDLQEALSAMLETIPDFPDYDFDKQISGHFFCKCPLNSPPRHATFDTFVENMSQLIIINAFDRITEIEARKNMQVVASEFVDTLICGVAQDVINDNFEKENYERFCTEIYSSAASESSENSRSQPTSRRLERSPNLDCNCTISVCNESVCETCDSNLDVGSAVNERMYRRLLGQCVTRGSKGSTTEAESLDCQGSLDWIHESIPEESEVPGLVSDAKQTTVPHTLAKRLFGAAGHAAQERHKSRVLQAGWRRSSEPIYNLTNIKPLSAMNSNRRQTLPVSQNIKKDEDNLASFAQELLAWMDRHERKLMRLNGSYTYREEILFSFDEQLMKSSESIPLLEILEMSDRGSSRRSSGSGFRDFTLASFEEELMNTSFDMDAASKTKASSFSPNNCNTLASNGRTITRTVGQTELSERDFAACCHNFPIDSISSTPRTSVDVADLPVTCHSPTLDSSSVCSYEDACDIFYRELECFASTLAQQILPVSLVDAAAVLKARSDMGVKSHKRPICCVCHENQSYPQLHALLQWVVASYLGAPSLIYFTSAHPSLRKFEELREALKLRGWTAGHMLAYIVAYKNSVLHHDSHQLDLLQRPVEDLQPSIVSRRPEEQDLFSYLLEIASH